MLKAGGNCANNWRMEPGFSLESQREDYSRLLEALVLEHSPATQEAYRRDTASFAAWLGAPSPLIAARVLVTAGPLRGNSMVLNYMDAQKGLGLSPATIARRLSCLRELIRKARILGFCNWSLEIKRPKVRAYKDTRGPGMDAIERILEATQKESPPIAARDAAMVRLLFDLGLRRGEVASIRIEDVERVGIKPSVWIQEKGATERTRLALPLLTFSAIQEWIEWRGDHPGPLFIRLDGAEATAALTGRSVHLVVRRLGESCGVRSWPHGLRHSAITQVLNMTNDMRAGQRFARHGSIATTQIYDDNRMDPAGALSEALASSLHRRSKA